MNDKEPKDVRILITGAAGFIGSNFVKFLNNKGFTNLILADDLTNGHKFKNLKGCNFSHYLDKDDVFDFLSREAYYQDWILSDIYSSDIDAIIHLGACSDTTEWNGKYVMNNNYDFSVRLLNHVLQLDKKVKFIYASSASVYGNEKGGAVDPLNVYAFSKLTFDQYVIERFLNIDIDEDELPQIVGLRLFNIFGPNENHKGNQASPIHKFFNQAKNGENIKIFDVDAKRDFVYVDDICSVIFHFLGSEHSGIFDVGTSVPRTFQDVASLIQKEFKNINIETIPFPQELHGHYQFYTKADLTTLRASGYNNEFLSLEEGIKKFFEAKYK